MNTKIARNTFLIVVAAVAFTACGGGSGDNAQQTTANTPPIVLAPTPAPITAATSNKAALSLFWAKYGRQESFPPMYVDVVENVLLAEEKVLAKDYKSARVIIDTLLSKYPLSNDVWWTVYRTGEETKSRPHLGEPGIYAAFRMLDEITRVGVTAPSIESTPIQMTIVMPTCSNIVPRSGPTLLNYPLDTEIEDNSYAVVRQSLRLFQSYVWAISGGALRVELNFHRLNQCFDMNSSQGFTGNFPTPISQLPADVAAKTDMYWLIYPSKDDGGLEYGVGGGIGKFGQKPVFICGDDWLTKKPAGQGGGARTEVERLMYLPEWMQHEFFHHLFSSWPQLGLEKTGHQWFDRSTWPADFIGRENMEEDYYAEALRKRLYMATPSITQMLKRADPPKL